LSCPVVGDGACHEVAPFRGQDLTVYPAL